MRVLIVDDEPLARERIRTLLGNIEAVDWVGECADGAAAVAAIAAHPPDLVLLDVQMPEVDGFEVIRRVGPDRMPAVVFVTAYEQYAVRAFEVHALDYLLKPVAPERFAAALERAGASRRDQDVQRRLVALLGGLERRSAYPARLVIKSRGRVTFLEVSQIDWIEAADNYVRLHADREVHTMRATMGRLEAMLDPAEFARIHRSTIVRIARIREIQPWFKGEYAVILADGTKLTSSRGYRRALEPMLRQE